MQNNLMKVYGNVHKLHGGLSQAGQEWKITDDPKRVVALLGHWVNAAASSQLVR